MWTAEQFNKYWGYMYMDSFWVLHSTRLIKDSNLLVSSMTRIGRKVTELM